MTISRVPQKRSDWLIVASLMTSMGIPPKDPPDDDDQNEEDEDEDEDNDNDNDNDNEEDQRPAVIREPDEC
jgi:hypothetical protein